MSIDRMRKLNPHIEIKDIEHINFSKYGRIVNEYDFTRVIDYLNSSTPVPEEGNIYVPSVKDMENMPIYSAIEKKFYGGMPAEIGYCNGRNSTLNGLEYHKGSEIDVAASDAVLLLGMLQDVKGYMYEASKVEAFYLSKGTAVELYGTTLHFGPCKVSRDGFRVGIILPAGTNLPLDREIGKEGEDRLLFAKNKWLLAHPLRKPLIEKGAHPGIIGDNIEIYFE